MDLRRLQATPAAAMGLTAVSALVCVLLAACSEDKPVDPPDTGPAEEARHGLTSEQAAQPLAKIGDTTITVGAFADQLAAQNPYLRARYNSPERRKEFLDNLIRFELLAIEARRKGYDKLPDVQRTRKQVMIQQMMKAEFGELVQLADISDDDIREYYESHGDEFHKPEQVRASHILIKNRAKAERLLRQILQNQTDINFFREAARANNEDTSTADTFGDLRFLSRPAVQAGHEEEAGHEEDAPPSPVPAAVREAAFSLQEIGQVFDELVESEAGFHIVKLTGRRAALNRPLEEVRRPIQNKLWRERRENAIQAFIDRLRQEANVEENFDLLGEVRVAIPEGVPAEALEHSHGAHGPHGPGKAPPFGMPPAAPNRTGPGPQ